MISEDTKVGTKVKLRADSKYSSRGESNPAPDVIGVVVAVQSPSYLCPVHVKWSNGRLNGYSYIDLDYAKPKRYEWFPKALEMHKAGESSKVISKSLGIPARTIRHNIQKHLEKLAPVQTQELQRERILKHMDIEELLNEPLPVPKLQTKKPTIFVIPDTQCKQGVDLGYIHWIGSYLARKKPDIIVMIGDWYDMASLSTYDKGKLSAEGKRVKEDIEAGDEGIRILESYIRGVPNYNPRRVVTLGNHEDRIDRFVHDNPAFEGYIGSDKLAFSDFGWEVYPFLTPVNICGINFVHYIPNTMNGKPMGGTALSKLKNLGESFVMGHVQTYDFAQRPLQLSGKHQIGLVVGACYDHDEGYKGVQGNHHFRGCVMLYECADGYAMHKAITLGHMKELYEQGV